MEIFVQITLNSIIAGAIYTMVALGFNLIYSSVRFFDLGYGVMAITTKKNDAFAVAYEKRWGEKPGFWADYGYDGFMVLAKAYGANGKEWQKNIAKTNDQNGASGAISFDEAGVLIPTFELQVLQGGKFGPVK